MNKVGTIVGYYSDSSFTQYGFIYQSGIGYTELAGPDGSASDSLVEATSINASGEVDRETITTVRTMNGASSISRAKMVSRAPIPPSRAAIP